MAKLISIIGPPAVGKTTLARHLVKEMSGRFIREDFAGNPFLADSCIGKADARLPAQLYFLMSRVQQLSTTSWPEKGLLISDYGFCQDRIFAQMNLTKAELNIYEPLRLRMEKLVHQPDLLILLDTEIPILLDRIARRGRDFERVMDGKFLSDIRAAYEKAAGLMKCPVIRVDTGLINLRQPAGRKELIKVIKEKARI